ncbi:HDOD domain-containing protein [Gemmatimonas sp.]|uniref:HDOD domain-containing protein n=1 Tax=Gemmatimonas sp. TaxID=1962908 RepID=UPI00286AEC1B|nr:HDOD domain-containing protein [Gemmatimonas sp.]
MMRLQDPLPLASEALHRHGDAGAAGVSVDSFSIRTRLARIMEGGDFPALSRQVIDTISTIDDDVASLQRLANVVLREYGLTLSVVRTANSVHYRRGGRPTESATHAMMMLGARVVRQLAGSMMLFEHFQRRSPELKELMILSLLTANHARATALQLGHDDPEAAHLSGMFRNLGEVLVACYFHDDYQRIRSLVQDDGRSEASALRMVLGFAYTDFGVEVANQWGLPDTIAQGIRATAHTSPSLLASVTAFSHELTSTLYQTDSNSSVGPALDAMLDAHRPRIRLTREQVGRIASDALKETREVLLGTDSEQSVLHLRELNAAARRAFGASLTLADDGDAPTMLAEPDVTARARLRNELDDAVDPASGATIGTVLLQAMEVIMRGGPFDRVVTCFMTGDRMQLVARTGLGTDIDALLSRFSFPVSARGGPVVALTQQRQSVYLPTDRTMHTMEQRWATEQGVSQFGVFPLIVLGKVIGCMYCDRLGSGPAPDRATVRFTKSIADLVVDAIARRRS